MESGFAPTKFMAANTLLSHNVPPPVAAWSKKPCSVTAMSESQVNVPTLRYWLLAGVERVPVARVLLGFNAVVLSVISAVCAADSAVEPVPMP